MFLLPSLLSLILAVVGSFAVGMLWYSPFLFGTIWAKLKHFDPKELKKAQQKMGAWYALNTVGTLIQVVVLYNALRAFNPENLFENLLFASILWLGFISVTQLSMMIFSKDAFNLQLFIIDTSYQLASVLLMSAVLFLLHG